MLLLLSLSCGHELYVPNVAHKGVVKQALKAELKHYRWSKHTDILTMDLCEKINVLSESVDLKKSGCFTSRFEKWGQTDQLDRHQLQLQTTKAKWYEMLRKGVIERGNHCIISGGCIPESIEEGLLLIKSETEISQECMQPAEMPILIHTLWISSSLSQLSADF